MIFFPSAVGIQMFKPNIKPSIHFLFWPKQFSVGKSFHMIINHDNRHKHRIHPKFLVLCGPYESLKPVQELYCLLLLMPPVSCSTIHSLGHLTLIVLVAPLHTSCSILAEICLTHVVCLASILAYHVSHVGYLVIYHVRYHLLDAPTVPC